MKIRMKMNTRIKMRMKVMILNNGYLVPNWLRPESVIAMMIAGNWF